MLKGLIQQIVVQTINASKPMSLSEGEVVNAPPNLKVKLLSNEKLILPKELLIVPQHLTNHKRTVKLNDTANGNASISNTQTSISDGTFNLSEGTLEFLDELKKGDKVLLAAFPGGQKFFILDRIITY